MRESGRAAQPFNPTRLSPTWNLARTQNAITKEGYNA